MRSTFKFQYVNLVSRVAYFKKLKAGLFTAMANREEEGAAPHVIQFFVNGDVEMLNSLFKVGDSLTVTGFIATKRFRAAKVVDDKVLLKDGKPVIYEDTRYSFVVDLVDGSGNVIIHKSGTLPLVFVDAVTQQQITMKTTFKQKAIAK